MAMTCQTCKQPNIDAINQQIVNGASLRDIALQTKTSHQSVKRHKDSCLKALFQEVRAEKRAGLLQDVDELKAEIEEVKKTFPTNPQARVQLIARRKEAIELEAKLTGAFQENRANDLSLIALVKAYEAARQDFVALNDRGPNEAEQGEMISRILELSGGKVDAGKFRAAVQELGGLPS